MNSVIFRILIATIFASGIFSISCSSGGSSSPPPEQKQFYVDVAGGSDSNAGTSLSPWQSLAKVSTSSIPFGSTIYLKRGSVWFEQLTIPSSGVTIDSYGTGTLPRIDGSKEITGWIVEGSGIYSSPTVTLGSDETLGNLSENGVMMSFQTWTTDAATTFSGAPAGSFTYDSALSRLYIKPASAPLGNVYRASIKIFGINAASKTDVAVQNLEITRFSLHGVHFKDCIRCEVRDSLISKGGGAMIAPDLYAGNGIEFGNASSNGVVDGVTVSEIFDSGITPQTYLSGQTLSSLSISNSLASSCGFAGIEVSVLSNGGTTGSSVNDIVISGVTVTNSGRGWSGRRYGTEGHGIRIQADSGAGAINGVRLETTTIDGSAGDGVKLAGDIGIVHLHRMNIRNNRYGISLLEPNAASVKLQLTSSLVYDNTDFGIIYNSPTAAGFELFHNTFSDNSGINMAVLGWSGTAKIQNNIFYGSSAITHLYSQPTLTGALINNNCYNEHPFMFGYGSTSYDLVSAFTASTGFESNGIGGTVELTDPAAGDFTLKATSPCRILGDPAVGVTEDYSGFSFASPPSSGAYQY